MSQSKTSHATDARNSSPSARSGAIALPLFTATALVLLMVSVMVEANDADGAVAQRSDSEIDYADSGSDNEALAGWQESVDLASFENLGKRLVGEVGDGDQAVRTGLNASGCSITSGSRDIASMLLALISITLLAWRRTLRLHARPARTPGNSARHWQ